MIKYRNDLTKLAQLAPQLAKEALAETAQDVLSISQDLCPVRTGQLKASGRVEEVNDSTYEIVYGNESVDYALPTELGAALPNGGTVPAQPFLSPAVVQAPAIFEKRIREKMKQLK